jgi:hypothetical protein
MLTYAAQLKNCLGGYKQTIDVYFYSLDLDNKNWATFQVFMGGKWNFTGITAIIAPLKINCSNPFNNYFLNPNITRPLFFFFFLFFLLFCCCCFFFPHLFFGRCRLYDSLYYLLPTAYCQLFTATYCLLRSHFLGRLCIKYLDI